MRFLQNQGVVEQSKPEQKAGFHFSVTGNEVMMETKINSLPALFTLQAEHELAAHVNINFMSSRLHAEKQKRMRI